MVVPALIAHLSLAPATAATGAHAFVLARKVSIWPISEIAGFGRMGHRTRPQDIDDMIHNGATRPEFHTQTTQCDRPFAA
jgi:hypothetical protein